MWFVKFFDIEIDFDSRATVIAIEIILMITYIKLTIGMKQTILVKNLLRLLKFQNHIGFSSPHISVGISITNSRLQHPPPPQGNLHMQS